MICIIGGSGFYNFLDDEEPRRVSTPYGEVTMMIGTIEERKVGFIPRHGDTHSIAPHQINYQANIYAAHTQQAEKIITTNALGSLHQKYQPGQFVLPEQVIDMTHGRAASFKEALVRNNEIDELFSSKLRGQLIRVAAEIDENIIDGGTIVVTNGPRFETIAEIDAYRILGADYVGMTTAPEVFLAKKAGIPYVSLGIITNLAAGMQSEITADEVFELFSQRIERIKLFFRKIISSSI